MSLITVNHKSESAFNININNTQISADLTKADGGSGDYPSPTELLVGSLGACIGIMVNKYCQNHGYTDGEVEVNLTYELGSKPSRVAAIVIDLEIPKDVPEAKKEAIKRIAHLCPIHKTLQIPPSIDVEIV